MNRFCHYCSEPISPDGMGVWRRVIGWERKSVGSSRRGGSDIALREPRDEYAHAHCVDAAKAGLSVGQEALL